MSGLIDAALAYTFIKKLTLPFEQWDAYKQGIIDAEGNFLVKGSKKLSAFDHLILKLKRIIMGFPGGKSRIATIAAAMLLMKEDTTENLELKLNKYIKLLEDEVPANNVGSGNIAKFDPILVKKVLKRKKPNENAETAN